MQGLVDLSGCVMTLTLLDALVRLFNRTVAVR